MLRTGQGVLRLVDIGCASDTRLSMTRDFMCVRVADLVSRLADPTFIPATTTALVVAAVADGAEVRVAADRVVVVAAGS